MEDTTSESTDGGNPGRRIVIIRVPASDIFLKLIAGPFVLGISSGAKMMVALVMIFFWRDMLLYLLIR